MGLGGADAGSFTRTQCEGGVLTAMIRPSRIALLRYRAYGSVRCGAAAAAVHAGAMYGAVGSPSLMFGFSIQSFPLHRVDGQRSSDPATIKLLRVSDSGTWCCRADQPRSITCLYSP